MPSVNPRTPILFGRKCEHVNGEHERTRGRGRVLKIIAATIVLSVAVCVPASLLTISGETRKLRSLAVQTQSRIVGGSANYEGDPSSTPYSNKLTRTRVAGSSSIAELAILGSASEDEGSFRAVEYRSEHQKYGGEAPQRSDQKLENIKDADTPPLDEAVARVDVGLKLADKPPQPCGYQDGMQVAEGAVLEQAGECPRCDSIFEKLGRTEHGMNVQDVSMQLRGEPKSGTGFMYEWAVNALMTTCAELNRLYGQKACSVTWSGPKSRGLQRPVSRTIHITHMREVLLVFEPDKKSGTNVARAPCKCENVDRVSVRISSLLKHNLPVPSDCPWQHVDGVTGEGRGCTTVDGRGVRNHKDTAKCVQDTPCDVVDNRTQMLILRDPRAVVVSMYYYGKKNPGMSGQPRPGESVEKFALRMLPTICGFVHLRYLLLSEVMPDKSVECIYEESLLCPFGWHRRMLSSVGLAPPWTVLMNATDTALRNDFGFMTKGVDTHPGGMPVGPTRSFEDEISAEAKARLDDMCRVWLPPVLLKKFGIAPEEDRSPTVVA